MSVKIHGKKYTTVAERLQAIHLDYDQLSITTEILDDTDKYVTVKAVVEIGGTSKFSGHAREVIELKNSRAVNFTFALENAETSAVGRALSNAGYGGDERSSVEELESIRRQREAKESHLEDAKEELGDKPVEKTSGGNSNGVIDPAKLKERQAEFNALIAEAKLRCADRTWRKGVQDNFIELYGERHGYQEASKPLEVLERGEIAHAYKVLFPDMVDEE